MKNFPLENWKLQYETSVWISKIVGVLSLFGIARQFAAEGDLPSQVERGCLDWERRRGVWYLATQGSKNSVDVVEFRPWTV